MRVSVPIRSAIFTLAIQFGTVLRRSQVDDNGADSAKILRDLLEILLRFAGDSMEIRRRFIEGLLEIH